MLRDHLGLRDVRRSVTATALADLLLLLAATTRTLAAVVRRRFRFAIPTALAAVRTVPAERT